MRKLYLLVAVGLWLVPLARVWAEGSTVTDLVKSKCEQIDQKIQELMQLREELLRAAGVEAPPAPPAPPPKPADWTQKIKLTGYMQNRYEWFDVGVDQFTVRRAYLSLIAKPSDRSSAVMTWVRIGAGSTDVTWDNLFFDYKLTDTDTLRFGQAPTWFGLEAAQSSSARIPLERAAFLEGGDMRKPPGLYWRGNTDRGLYWIHTPQDCTRSPQLILGVVNGAFRDNAKNSQLTCEIDLKMMPTWGQWGLSWLDGSWQGPNPFVPQTPTPADVTFARNGLLGYVRYTGCQPWAAQSEYLTGRFGGHGVQGWYGQLERLLGGSGTAFAKYEWYDPDRDAGSDVYQSWMLGYAHQLDANNRLTLQLANAERAGANVDEAGFQWQYGF